MLKLVKMLITLLMFSHFQACVWGLGAGWMDAPNWITVFDEQYEDARAAGVVPSPLDRYAAAFYWSVMTLTSIGYGDVLPHSSAERILCSIYMLASGIVWAYVIGSVTAIVTSLNPNKIIYETTMDHLNYFMCVARAAHTSACIRPIACVRCTN